MFQNSEEITYILRISAQGLWGYTHISGLQQWMALYMQTRRLQSYNA
jgi:hypothetical protein